MNTRNFILIFNPRDNTKNINRFNMDCYHIQKCLNKTSNKMGTGAKNIRKALQGFKRISLLNANWFLYFNFNKIINPNKKRPLTIRVTKQCNQLFWSKVVNQLIIQLGLNQTIIRVNAAKFSKSISR